MNFWFLGAAGVSLFTCLVHFFVGGKEVARPLLAAQHLEKVAKFTAYYCWHLVTIAIAGLTLAFVFAALDPAAISLAVFATAASALFTAWNLAMIALFKLKLMHFPQWILFLPAAILGMLGLLV